MNAISKPDLIIGTIEEVNFVNEPIPALSTLTKTNRFYAWMKSFRTSRCLRLVDVEHWTQTSYDAWVKAGRPEREY